MTASPGRQIPNWLDVAARSHPDKLALAFAGQRWTFADLRESVVAAAAVLSTARAGSPGRIGILSANRPGVVFAVHAATRMTVPFVPLNWRQTADEIAWQLRDAGITVLVVDEERAAVAKTACADLPVTIVPIAELERLPPRQASAERATPDRSRAGSDGHLHLGDQRAAEGRSHHLWQSLVQRNRLSTASRSSPAAMSGWRRCRSSTSAGWRSSSAASSAPFP